MRFLIPCLYYLFFSLGAGAMTYEDFPVELAPFSRNPELAAEWHQLQFLLKKEAPLEVHLKRQVEVAEALLLKEPDWIDMHWMMAKAAFDLGSYFQKPEDRSYARSVFVRGHKAVEKCLKRQQDHVICKLYMGAMIGKIASIDGIFSAIRKAKDVEQYWIDVTQSKYNFQVGHRVTIQGSARFGLGIFYRLIPDYTIVKWLFGVQGDLEKSIAYHREAIAIDSPNPCSKLMLAAALLCSAKGDTRHPKSQEGMRHLQEARHLVPSNSVTKSCWNDVPLLTADPSKACGYESSRQQDSSLEELNRVAH